MLEKFNSHIVSKDGCWLWDHPNKGSGYGEFREGSAHVLAHRFSYEHFNGPISEGMHVDHICRVRRCVNPEHLRLLSLVENVLCGDGITARNRVKSHCPKGHPYDQANTSVNKGKRSCRRCKTENMRRYREARKRGAV